MMMCGARADNRKRRRGRVQQLRGGQVAAASSQGVSDPGDDCPSPDSPHNTKEGGLVSFGDLTPRRMWHHARQIAHWDEPRKKAAKTRQWAQTLARRSGVRRGLHPTVCKHTVVGRWRSPFFSSFPAVALLLVLFLGTRSMPADELFG